MTQISELPGAAPLPVTPPAPIKTGFHISTRLLVSAGVLSVVLVLGLILFFTGSTIQSQNLAAYQTQCKAGTLGATAQVAIYAMFGTLTPTASTTPLVPAVIAQQLSPTETPLPTNTPYYSAFLGSLVPTSTDVNYLPPDVELGKVVFTSAGCSACHDLTGKHDTVGPSLMHIVTMAHALFPNSPPEAYLRQSILEPDRYVSPGYPAGVMPKNYDNLLSNAQVNNLIAYLMTFN